MRHPIDPGDFNGVVLVEWNNVTAGRDYDPGSGFLHPEAVDAVIAEADQSDVGR